MKLENLQLIQKLKTNAAGLDVYFDKYRETIAKHDCDKYGAEFGLDDRFIVFRINTFFSAKTGYYGNSSSSTFGRFDQELIDKHMKKYLDAHKEQMFKYLAKSMSAEAKSLTENALKEIENLNELVAEYTKEPENE